MKHKRWLLLIGILVVASLGLSACGGAPAPAEEEAPPPAEEEEEEAAPVEEEEEEAPMECVSESDATKVEVCPGEKVRIGAANGITGPIAEMGQDMEHANQIAEMDINEAGGILGFEVEIDYQDSACDGDAGTNVANLFAADPTIVAVAGANCSGPTMAMEPILQEARVPFCTPSATNPDVISEQWDIANRAVLTDKAQADFDADYVYNTLGLTKVAVMHDGTDYGLGAGELFQSAFEALGGEVTGLEGIQVGDTDFRPVLTKISADAPELVFFGGYSTEAGLITAQMPEAGLGDAVFMGIDGAFAQSYLDAAGDAAEGQYISFPAGDESEEGNAEFDAKYEAEFGVLPDDLGPYHANAYDCVMMVTNAITSVGVVGDDGKLTIDREELVAALRGTSGFEGLTGTITCTELGECSAGGIQMHTIENGEFVLVAGFGAE